jgi:hypothetical protein
MFVLSRMSFPKPRLLCLLPSLLVLALSSLEVQGQIVEGKPTPGLEEGILFWSGSDPVPNRPRHPEMYHAMLPTDEIGTGDFSLSMVIAMALDPAPTNGQQIASKHSGKAGWKLMETSEGALKFMVESGDKVGPYIMETPPRIVAGKKNVHIVVSVRRDARQPYSGIWVDGIEVVSGMMPPVSLSTPGTAVTNGDVFVPVDLRIYNRALTRPEILELTLRGTGTASDKPKPKHPAPPPDGPRFIPQPDETIVLIGGTEAVALAESGELEALLLMAFPQTKFHFRCLAWEGDTVFRQDRPMNFGSLEQQLRRVNAGAVFMMFGRQECLDAAQPTRSGGMIRPTKTPLRSDKPEASEQGASRARNDGGIKPPLLEFKAAFEKLLTTVEKVTPNIVVIGPPPFEKKAPPLPDVAKHSAELRAYSKIMQDAAGQRGLTFCDVLGCESISHVWEPVITLDGAILNQFGVSQTANVASYMLGFGYSLGKLDLMVSTGAETKDFVKAVQTKSHLWHYYWRPSNWAFLHGDRTNQPSSRDPVNPQVRLFPAEQEEYLPLIKEAEEKIFQLVQEAQKKVP